MTAIVLRVNVLRDTLLEFLEHFLEIRLLPRWRNLGSRGHARRGRCLPRSQPFTEIDELIVRLFNGRNTGSGSRRQRASGKRMLDRWRPHLLKHFQFRSSWWRKRSEWRFRGGQGRWGETPRPRP